MANGLQIEIKDGIEAIDAVTWNRLAGNNPFVSHGFLRALERHGSVADYSGWQPMHLVVREGDQIVALAPMYAKSHSWGEFVFDWAWAEAHEKAELAYYPKLLVAAPLTPVAGPRLMTESGHPVREQLPGILQSTCEQLKLSSIHVNFVQEADAQVLRKGGFLQRDDWQYHWSNPGYDSFDQFLAELTHKKRKNIRQERRRLREAGWQFERVCGRDAGEWHWLFAHGLYKNTFERKGNWALLTQGVFRELGQNLADNVVMVLARRGDKYRAGAWLMHDGHTLYGRYWGAFETSPGLHFETCYYQGIEWAIEHGLKCFDPGAQGTHKIARGFEPVATHSFHHIANEDMRHAIERHLQTEQRAQVMRGAALRQHSAFRSEQG